MRMLSRQHRFLFLLQTAAFLTLAGYAWLCWTGKSPLSVLYWNEQWLRGAVSSLSGMSWEAYLASPATSRFWSGVEWGMGLALSLAAVSAWIAQAKPRLAAPFLLSGFLLVLLFSILYGFDKIFFWVQMPEYALQWGAPLFLAVWLSAKSQARVVRGLRIVAAVTFAAHGLYALNIAPRPGSFIEMTMSILHVSQSTAGHILTVAGALDWAAALLILLPFPRWQKAALIYMVLWGLLTTLARWAAYVHFDLPWWPQTLLAWTPEVLIRTPHFLIPLALIRR